ncbi:MAG: MFS transporter [Planctomycetes bacterium]|nr:MFS transporter [Planctomycetota bacterium]
MNEEDNPGLTKTAWFAVVLLMPVALLNYLDRQMMASMQSSVIASIPDFAEADNPQAMWGFMLGQFKWVYAGFSLLGGIVADRFSRRWTVAISLLVWSMITWWTGQVTSYQELLWARSLMGVSEAFYIPAALALIVELHAEGTRSRAVGMHQMAIYLGVIAGGFGGYIASNPDLGWRWAFVASGIVGMTYAVPLPWLLGRSMASHSRKSSADAETNEREPGLPPAVRDGGWSRTLLGNPSFVLLVLYFTLPAMAAWIVRDWMPAILKKEFGIGEGQAGVSATLYWQLAAIAGALFGGWMADRWMQVSHRGRIYTSAIGVGLIVPAIFGVGNATSLMMAIGFLILFGIGWGLFDGNNMPILSQIVPSAYRATGYGVMNFVSISCGGLADWGFGMLRDAKVPLNRSFGVFALLAVVSIGLVLLIRPKPEGNENTAERAS